VRGYNADRHPCAVLVPECDQLTPSAQGRVEVWLQNLAFAASVWSWYPPVGVFIAILGLLGVIVPLVREHIGRREKAIWTVVMFALVLLEIRSIYLDRAAHEQSENEARQLQLDNFNQIGQGIRESISKSDEHFDESLKESARQFSTTVGRIEESAKITTGGDSYCIAIFNYRSSEDQNDGYLLVYQVGNYPLHDVNMRIVDLAKLFSLVQQQELIPESVQTASTTINLGTLAVKERKILPQTFHFSPSDTKRDFNFRFDAMNGSWSEQFRQSKSTEIGSLLSESRG
jgi:hypothetical protein